MFKKFDEINNTLKLNYKATNNHCIESINSEYNNLIHKVPILKVINIQKIL